jgi:hypothetical protein
VNDFPTSSRRTPLKAYNLRRYGKTRNAKRWVLSLWLHAYKGHFYGIGFPARNSSNSREITSRAAVSVTLN